MGHFQMICGTTFRMIACWHPKALRIDISGQVTGLRTMRCDTARDNAVAMVLKHTKSQRKSEVSTRHDEDLDKVLVQELRST